MNSPKLLRRRLVSAFLVLLVSFNSQIGPAGAASRPADFGGVGEGIIVQGRVTACPSGRVCLNATASCSSGCWGYNFAGTSSQWAGRPNTFNDEIAVGGRYVGADATFMYNNQSSGRRACAYYSSSYDGSTNYRRVNAGASSTLPFTGAMSVASIPATSTWICWN